MPPAVNREAWETTGLDYAMIVAAAEAELAEPIPKLTDDLYLDFMRSGRREPFTVPYQARIDRAARLALAECLEFEGRFIPALQDILRAILAEKTWVYPMHDGPIGYPSFHGECEYIDLGAAVRAANLGAIHAWLGNQIGAGLSGSIQTEVERRLVRPYLGYVFRGAGCARLVVGDGNYQLELRLSRRPGLRHTCTSRGPRYPRAGRCVRRPNIPTKYFEGFTPRRLHQRRSRLLGLRIRKFRPTGGNPPAGNRRAAGPLPGSRRQGGRRRQLSLARQDFNVRLPGFLRLRTGCPPGRQSSGAAGAPDRPPGCGGGRACSAANHE